MMRFLSSVNLFKCRTTIVQPSCGIRQSVEEKLGLPEKPRRPLNAYLKYLSKIRPDILAKNPNSHPKDVMKIASTMWKNLSEASKKAYDDEYKREMESFSIALNKYNNSLTPEQKQEIKDAVEELKEAKDRRDNRLAAAKRNKELGKPVRPPTSYFLFFLSQQKDRKDMSLTEFQSVMATKWAALPDETKRKYAQESAKLKEDHEKRLIAWEKKMIDAGNLDVVRHKTLEQKIPKKDK